MLNTLLKRIKKLSIANKAGDVSLSIDDVDVITEALSFYEAGLQGKRFGYFSSAASSAKSKVQSLYPELFKQFVSQKQ